jgi:hypothetical protein
LEILVFYLFELMRLWGESEIKEFLEGWGFEDEIDLSCICADILGDFACLIH